MTTVLLQILKTYLEDVEISIGVGDGIELSATVCTLRR